MAKIDISNWGEFLISDIFQTEATGNSLQVPTGAMMARKDLYEGIVPRITVSNFNNGITGYYAESTHKNYRVYENFISVSFLGTVFYQSQKVSLDMKVHCLKPKEIELNANIAEFLVSVIKRTIQYYAYSDQLSSTVLPNLSIKLPVTSTNEPDFAYMDEYMKNVIQQSKTNLSNLKTCSTEKTAVDISGWKRFYLYDEALFEIDMGTKLDKAKMTTISPTINFVGRANNNNGITTRVDKVSGIEPYEAGNLTLSLGGEYLGSCFIQPDQFYVSQNVVVLMPKWAMSFNVKMFISAMIFRESRMYYKAFIDELNRHIKTDFSFLLPVTPEGTPDWEYMDNYMTKIMNESKATLKQLRI